jgi:photosystem I subunit 11
MGNFVKPYKNDPFVGHLSTPVTTSAATRAILGNLPAYRTGISSLLRGLEVGMAHGYFLMGPFTLLGPLRNSSVALLAGFMSTIGLICIMGVALAAYGNVTYTTSSDEDILQSKNGWQKFTSGFMVGAFGGAGFAFLLLNFIG